MLPTILVETPSKVPPITPPTSGIILPKLIAPFSPNLVRSLKPTRLLIAVIVSLEMGNDSNLLIVFYVQIMPDDFVMQLHRF